jgi:hypothetical protein
MRELEGDLFDPPLGTTAVCIPTNGNVRARKAVMGAGLAKTARDRWPGIEYELGRRIMAHGNHVWLLTKYEILPSGVHAVTMREHNKLPYHLIAFPTKSSYQKPATTDLVRRSAIELRALYEPSASGTIALPRVGCGLGGLRWEIVRPILEEELPGDRYLVLHKE